MELKKKKIGDNYDYMPDYSLDDHSETMYMDDSGKEVPVEEATHGITRIYDKDNNCFYRDSIIVLLESREKNKELVCTKVYEMLITILKDIY